MTGTPTGGERAQTDSKILRALQGTVLGGGLLFLLIAAALQLTWLQQAVLGGVLIALGAWINRSSSSYLVTLMLMLLSCYATLRYAYWRFHSVVHFFGDSGIGWTWLDAFFIALLLLAELYAFVTLFLGYVQTLWPLRRTPVALEDDPEQWPHVDLLIPTYNEPLSVVKYTALAAINIDWPVDKLHVYMLDDGGREEFRAFCEQAGIGYIRRKDHRHAKAGNINHALKQISSPFVAIFDSDHVPTRSFLQLTMGWFGRDPKLAMLQTPHHFYSPDPFERNLNQFRVVPNEGELFYGVVQDGNDFWNATFFCGSCAVMRRSALDEVGGIAVETVTEDAHTSLRMQMKGWNTAYINIPQAAGLATERLSSHIRQRIRWARGMVQVLRIENPLFAPGLSMAQRLCYFNAMSHFLYALPRLVLLTAPLIYLLFGHVNVPGYWAAILAYALPHLVISSVARSRVQGQHRHSFWNEIYETVLAPYIFLPTMLALVHPKFGRFHVTAKGGVVKRSYFDTRIAKPFLLLLLMNGLGLLCAIPRLLQFPHVSGAGRFAQALLNIPAKMYDGTHPGTIWMNVAWTVFNLTVLGVATAVARESQQRRQTVRVSMTVPATVMVPHGTLLDGATTDVSSGGVMIRSEKPLLVNRGDPVRLVFPVLQDQAVLPATVVAVSGNVLRAHFDPLTLEQEEALTMMLYSRADTWLGWGEAREVDRPLVSMFRIMQLAVHGLWTSGRGLFPGRKTVTRYAGAVQLLALGIVAGSLAGAVRMEAQNATSTAVQSSRPKASAPSPPQVASPGAQLAKRGGAGKAASADTFERSMALSQAHPHDIVLRGQQRVQSVSFGVRTGEQVKSAVLRLRYQFSPGLQPGAGQILARLNGTQFAAVEVLAPTANAASSGGLGFQTASLAIPPELVLHANELEFEFVAPAASCAVGQSIAWAQVDPSSSIELTGVFEPIENDLQLLPLPFYDQALSGSGSIQMVFLRAPSRKALQAAGVVASWFGIASDERPARFPVSVGRIPQGNAVVFVENSDELPPGVDLSGASGPTIAVRPNPNDAHAKILVFAGANAEEVLIAAKVLALERGQIAGATVDRLALRQFHALRSPDDAPRWLPEGVNTPFGDLEPADELQSDGSKPVQVPFRLAPDLYYGARQNVRLHLWYRYNAVPIGDASTLNLFMNGGFISATPMPHSTKASADLRTVVPVPVSSLRPFQNVLEGRFLFQGRGQGDCQNDTAPNADGAILRDSYLDLRGVAHWAAMPNLQLFANAGYPFTRMADLSDTAVVLPDQPAPEVIELYLTMMSRFGAATGYPAVNVAVTDADGMDTGRDLLVLGSVEDMPALERLESNLPVQISADGLVVHQASGFLPRLRRSAWWRLEQEDRSEALSVQIHGGLPEALIEGLRWRGRSVVLIALRSRDESAKFIPAFLSQSQGTEIGQSVSVLADGHFASYRVGSDRYSIGTLSWWGRLSLLIEQNPWLLIAAVAVCCLILAAVLRAMLRRHARHRLRASMEV